MGDRGLRKKMVERRDRNWVQGSEIIGFGVGKCNMMPGSG